MAESPPPSQPPSKSENSDPQHPKPTSKSEDPPRNHQPQAPHTQSLPAESLVDLQEQLNPDEDQREEPQIVGDDQEQDDPEPEQEGMSVTLSHSSISDSHSALESKGNPPVSSVRRAPKRKKGLGKKSQVALEKKLQTLSQNFNPIPFVPAKSLDFSRHEELLKRLGLWDFAHIEFDRNLRADLIAKLIVNYTPKQRFFYVNDCRIGVNRADLGRALKLPGKKVAGDCEGEKFPPEFLSFLDEFVSNWMLLHEDLWCMPTEVVNWTNLVKDGHPEKVDWAGLVWFMVEKELAQGPNLKDCYYASHLQQLIKVQKEELLRDDPKVDLTVEDDEDGDVKMLYYEVSLGRQRSVEKNVEDRDVQVAPMEIVGDADKMEKVDDAEKMEGRDADKVEKVEDVVRVENGGNGCDAVIADEVCKVENVGGTCNFGSAEEVCKVENVGGEHIVGSANEVHEVENVDDVHNGGSDIEDGKLENVEMAECVGNIENTDEHVENVDNADEHAENADNVDERVEILDNTESVEEEGKDGDMMDFGYCKEDEQGQWFLDGKNEGGQHFLQRCSVAGAKLSMEGGRQAELGEGMKHEDVQDEGHVEGFRIMQKGPLDGMSQANLMQDFETGQLRYSSADLGGQPPLQLMSSRVENNVMLGGPSMFNHAGKREIDHEHDIAHHALNDNHKKMRIDGSWGHHKASEFDVFMDQILHLIGKAKMAHEAEKEEAYDQGNVNQQFIAHELARKDNEIMQLKCKLDELERRRLADIHRLDRELYLMNSVINGYRSALKDTQRAFAKFRKCCAVPDEPIYKDAGSGGVVKSIMELEKERIKQEQERKALYCFLEETYRKHLKIYDIEWNELFVKVQSLDNRLMTAAGDLEQLKEHHVNREASGSAPNESEDP